MSGCIPDPAIQPARDGVYLNVHVQPGARRCEVRGMHGDAVKIAIQAAARDGKANEAVLHFIADGLGQSRQRVELASGRQSRRKRIFLSGDAGELAERIRRWLNHD